MVSFNFHHWLILTILETYLFNCVEVIFHALDCDVLSSLDALGLQNFREGSLSFLANQSVLYTSKTDEQLIVSENERNDAKKVTTRQLSLQSKHQPETATMIWTA